MAFDSAPYTNFARRAMTAEFLDPDTEYELACAWRDYADEEALHRLITAYTRLAVSMAAKFKRYGAPQNDLIQEAGLGLMKAASKFDPDRGVRFSTYAVWWIKASIQDYVMRNWSMVRTGSTSAQKSLFFNMRRVRASIERETEALGIELSAQDMRDRIAAEIGVPVRDVELMEGRLAGADFSLNATQVNDEEGREWIDLLVDDTPQAEEKTEMLHDGAKLREWLLGALGTLSERERFIIKERKLGDTSRTLDSIGEEIGLSKERVRQIEAAALKKMRFSLEEQSAEIAELIG